MAKELPDHIVKAVPGGAPFAVPKDPNTPDPRDPAWKVQVFVKNNSGRIVPVPKWRAYEMIQNREGELSNKEEFEAYEKKYLEEESHSREVRPSMISEEEWERIQNAQPKAPDPSALDEPETVTELELEQPKQETPQQADKVLEAINQTNNKIDQLTGAILQLVEKGQKNEVHKPKQQRNSSSRG